MYKTNEYVQDFAWTAADIKLLKSFTKKKNHKVFCQGDEITIFMPNAAVMKAWEKMDATTSQPSFNFIDYEYDICHQMFDDYSKECFSVRKIAEEEIDWRKQAEGRK